MPKCQRRQHSKLPGIIDPPLFGKFPWTARNCCSYYLCQICPTPKKTVEVLVVHAQCQWMIDYTPSQWLHQNIFKPWLHTENTRKRYFFSSFCNWKCLVLCLVFINGYTDIFLLLLSTSNATKKEKTSQQPASWTSCFTLIDRRAGTPRRALMRSISELGMRLNFEKTHWKGEALCSTLFIATLFIENSEHFCY